MYMCTEARRNAKAVVSVRVLGEHEIVSKEGKNCEEEEMDQDNGNIPPAKKSRGPEKI
jgi:hypothetical protein